MNNQTNAKETMIRCSNCGAQFPTQVYTYVDVVQEPRAKALLLSGQLNMPACPSCGTQNTVATPLLYHDSTKELLIALVPMEMNMNKDEQERAIGSLMNRLPKDNFKGYMFNPTRTMTMQGLIELVLEGDGVTREMIEAQKERVKLVQTFIEAESQEALSALIRQHDESINELFITMFTSIAQRMLESGQQQLAQHIASIQQIVITESTYGQQALQQQEQQSAIVEEVAGAIQTLGTGAQREDFLDLALRYGDQNMHLQALVGLVRPAFDYAFFQIVAGRIEAATDETERATLENVRDQLLQLVSAIDQQQKMMMQQAANFLQAVVNQPSPREALIENAHMVDDTFVQVLEANIQQAEQQKNIALLTRLKEVQQVVYEVLQSQMTPELMFVNDLLQAEQAQAEQMIVQNIETYGGELVEVMQAVESLLEKQGNTALLSRLQSLRAFAEAELSG